MASVGERTLVVSLHDVHPGSFKAVRDQVDFLQARGINRFSLLLVPDYHQHGPFAQSPDLLRWLKERQRLGDEIVLHGFYHLRVGQVTTPSNFFWTRVYTANEAEFLDLERAEATKRMACGLSMLGQHGFRPRGFVAPAWLMSPIVLRAIFDLGFRYTNTVDRIFTAPDQSQLARSLCYSARAAWRRIASLGWNEFLWEMARGTQLLRLSLHPADLAFSLLRRQIGRIASGAVDAGFRPATYTDVIG